MEWNDATKRPASNNGTNTQRFTGCNSAQWSNRSERAEKRLLRSIIPTGRMPQRKTGGIPTLFSAIAYFLRCRIRARIRRFLRPIFLRPRPVFLTPTDPPLNNLSQNTPSNYVSPSQSGSSSLTVPRIIGKSNGHGTSVPILRSVTISTAPRAGFGHGSRRQTPKALSRDLPLLARIRGSSP
jgi:hypothetical protein